MAVTKKTVAKVSIAGVLLRQSAAALATALLGTSLLVASSAPASAARFDDLQLVYNATFANGSLQSGVDPLRIGPLKFGSSGEIGTNPSWIPFQGDYLIGVTRPAYLTGPPVVAGLYATPVNFDIGSVVGIRATFVAPIGPHNITDVWAITVAVRTGGIQPLVADPLASVTFQVRSASARLNTPGATSPANLPNLPQNVYNAIFSPTDPQPFTLEMLVDRINGRGEATLKVGEFVVSRSYEFAVFKATSGPAITNVGANIAVANAPGQDAYVRVRDFQIYSSKRN